MELRHEVTVKLQELEPGPSGAERMHPATGRTRMSGRDMPSYGAYP